MAPSLAPRRPGRRPRSRRRAGARAGRRRNARPGRCRRRRRIVQHERRTESTGSTGDGPLADLAQRAGRRRLGGRIVLLDSNDGRRVGVGRRRHTADGDRGRPDRRGGGARRAADGTIRTWSRDADSLVAGDTVETPDAIGRPRRLVASPDGRRVLVTGDAGSALVNLATGTAESVDLGATGLVAIDPSGRYAAIGGAQLTVWDLTTGQRAFAVPEPANALAWSGRATSTSRASWSAPASRSTCGTRRLGVASGSPTRPTPRRSRSPATGRRWSPPGWGATVAVWKLAAQIDDTGRVELAPPGPLTVGRPVTGALARYDGASTVDVADRRIDDDGGDRPDHRARAHRRRFSRCWSTAPTDGDCSRPRTAHRSISTPAATVIASR